MRRATPLLLAAVLLTGCSSTAPQPDATPTPEPTSDRATVNWDAYPPEYQRIIDEDTTAGNCQALQDTFDAAPDDVALLTYLDEALELAGCY